LWTDDVQTQIENAIDPIMVTGKQDIVLDHAAHTASVKLTPGSADLSEGESGEAIRNIAEQITGWKIKFVKG
jgi:transcription antitermination factor NusA-like protein